MSDNIIDFCKKNEQLYIYGAGETGQQLYTLLELAGINVKGFIVSDTVNEKAFLRGLEVKCITDLDIEKVSIIIAVSEKFRDEIIDVLKKKVGSQYNYCIYGIKEYMSLKRYINPVATDRFLKSVTPFSRKFGFDRGTPIDRYYMEQFLKYVVGIVSEYKTVLEVGENTYSKKSFRKAEKYDVLDYSNGMDLTDETTIPMSSYDVFLCMQTYNFIYDVRGAIHNSYRLLKKGGYLIATVAGNISQVSHSDMMNYGDYWRFTYLSIKKLVQEEFGNRVEVFPYGNSMAATAFIQGVAVEDLDNKVLLDVVDDEYAILIGIIAKKE